jgi:small GTP-binding protein
MTDDDSPLDPGDTIAALLTPLAPGAIAVIGLMGPRTDDILRQVLRRAGTASRPSAGTDDGPADSGRVGVDKAAPTLTDRRPTFCRIVEGGETLDDVVVVRIAPGRTTLAEINSHGGVRVAQRVLLLLEKHDATVVRAEDFVARLGAANLVELDVDRALLGVTSRRLTRWLLRQRAILPEYLRRLPSLSAAERGAFIERSLTAIRLLQGLRVALVGPPNAGKSTLANRLIGADRIVTSDQPGTTRDWVEETALIQGWPVTLTDTAGIREPTCEIEAEAVRRARRQAAKADAVIVVLDATTPVEVRREQLEHVTESLPPQQPRTIVLNKYDLTAPAATGLSAPALSVSARTGAGIAHLESALASLFGLDRLDEDLPTAFLPHHFPDRRANN